MMNWKELFSVARDMMATESSERQPKLFDVVVFEVSRGFARRNFTIIRRLVRSRAFGVRVIPSGAIANQLGQ